MSPPVFVFVFIFIFASVVLVLVLVLVAVAVAMAVAVEESLDDNDMRCSTIRATSRASGGSFSC
jgi:hypothetical protein